MACGEQAFILQMEMVCTVGVFMLGGIAPALQ